jgi:hypothetical protein
MRASPSSRIQFLLVASPADHAALISKLEQQLQAAKQADLNQLTQRAVAAAGLTADSNPDAPTAAPTAGAAAGAAAPTAVAAATAAAGAGAVGVSDSAVAAAVHQRLLSAACVTKQLQQQMEEYKRKFSNIAVAAAAGSVPAGEAEADAAGAGDHLGTAAAAATAAEQQPAERSSKRHKTDLQQQQQQQQQQPPAVVKAANGANAKQPKQMRAGSSLADNSSGSDAAGGSSGSSLGGSSDPSDLLSEVSSQALGDQGGGRVHSFSDISEDATSGGAVSNEGSDDGGSVDLEAEFEAQQAAEQAAAEQEPPSEGELDETTLAAIQKMRGKRWVACFSLCACWLVVAIAQIPDKLYHP